MKLGLNTRLYGAINNSEQSYAATVQNLRGDRNFMKREVLTRMLGAALPFFETAMFGMKLTAGMMDLGEGVATSVRNRRVNQAIFNKDRASLHLQSLGRSFVSIVAGLLPTVVNPNLISRFLDFNNSKKTQHVTSDSITNGIPLPPAKPTIKTDHILKRPTQETVDGIYDLFEEIDPILREMNITYTLCGGSLLGSVRHGGMIPWDDDGDIAIDHKDQARLLEAAEKLQAKGLKLVKHWCGYKICPINGSKKEEVVETYNPATGRWEQDTVTYPFIDIFPMEHDKQREGYVISSDFPESKKSWPNEIFTDAEWNSITEVPFGHLNLKGVAKEHAVKYCDRNYKKNWNTVACQWWDHDSDKALKKEDVMLVTRSSALHSKALKARIDHKAIAQEALATMTDEQMDSQWQLNKLFGNVRFINLDIDSHRLEAVKAEFESVGSDESSYERYSACLGRNLPKEVWDRMQSNYKGIDTKTAEGKQRLDRQHMGQTGCYMSHYRLIKEASEKYDAACQKLWALEKEPTATHEQLQAARAEMEKYSSTLIVEDDTLFGRIRPEDMTEKERHEGIYSDKMTKQGVGRIYYEAMRDLPKDWDVLHFMVIPWAAPQETDSKNLAKLNGGVSLIAYAVSANAYKRILQQLSKIDDPKKTFEPVDVELGYLQKEINAFVVTPAIALHPGEASTINNVVQSDNVKRKYWQCDWSFTQIP